MNTHTPGPYVYEPGPRGDPDVPDCAFMIVALNPPGEVIATVLEPVPQGTPEGNARLFHAAPDLLAALKSVEWSGEYHDRDDSWPCCPSCGADAPLATSGLRGNAGVHVGGCNLQAAIEKAEGKA